MRKQPKETIGKIVKYRTRTGVHYPFFADDLNWSDNHFVGVISKSAVIIDYEIITPTAEFMAKLKADKAFMISTAKARN